MEKKEFIKYLELETDDGSLYLYEKYQTDPSEEFNSEVPITREFFTGEEGIRGYNTLLFLDRQCEYTTKIQDIFGNCQGYNIHELRPHEFLEKVLPYLDNDETFERKRQEVLNILEYHAHKTESRMIKRTPPKLSDEKKDEYSNKILKKYIK